MHSSPVSVIMRYQGQLVTHHYRCEVLWHEYDFRISRHTSQNSIAAVAICEVNLRLRYCERSELVIAGAAKQRSNS